MKDCSHHIHKKVTPWNLFVNFIQSPQGIKWWKQAQEQNNERENQSDLNSRNSKTSNSN